MRVDATTIAAHVRARAAERERRLAVRADLALRVARELARSLAGEWGARRVFLFGSLARGLVHERSDIDLVVEGLSSERLLEASCALDAAAAPFNVDLIAWDRLPARQRASLDREGRVLP